MGAPCAAAGCQTGIGRVCGESVLPCISSKETRFPINDSPPDAAPGGIAMLQMQLFCAPPQKVWNIIFLWGK